MNHEGFTIIKAAPISIILLLAFALFTQGCNDAPCEGDNILLVVVDTLRADHLGPYGYRKRATPFISSFAREGAVFENAFSQASFTMASMGTMLTSTYPHHHGAGKHPSILGAENKTLQESLMDKGYRTAAMVSNPLLGPDSGFEQGFDQYFFLKEKKNNDAKGIVNQALYWMENNRDKPFFLWLHILDPHFPYNDHPGFSVESKNPDALNEYKGMLKKYRSGAMPVGKVFFDCPLSDEAVAEAIDNYDDEIAWVDYNFGRLMKGLKELGLSENTVVVFTSDHGESLAEHDLNFSHGFSVYEEAVKIPLIIKTPDKIKPVRKRIKTPVRLLDLMPTLLNLTGVKNPETTIGENLSALMFNKDKDPPIMLNYVFSESEPLYINSDNSRRYSERKNIFVAGDEGKWRSVRTDKYKLIKIPTEGKPKILLFDILMDPHEKNDISKEKPKIAEDLLNLIDKWRNDPSIKESVSNPELDEEWARRMKSAMKSIGY